MTENIDAEVVLNRMISIVQGAINTKLSAIDTDKNDSITLKQFSTNAYSVVTMDAQVMNYNPFMYIGASQPQTNSIGPGTEMELVIDFVTILITEGGDTNVWKRLLRYQRALKEIIQENWSDVKIPGMMFIENLEPRPIEELGNKPYMGVGIRVKTLLA